MNEEANVMLELDDIQSGVLRPRPSPYAATYILSPHRRPQSRAGVDAAAERSRDLGREPDQPVSRHLGQRRAHLPRAQGAGRAAGFARQLRVGVPAGDGRARESAGRHRREQPRELGSAARDAGRPRRARRGLAGWLSGSRRRSSAPARRTGSCRQGSRRSGGRTATRCPPRRSPSDSGTASAIRPSKGAAFPEPIPRNSPSRRANSSSAIPTRWAASR